MEKAMWKVLIAFAALISVAALAFAAPTRVPGSKQQDKLVKRVAPKYPPEAKAQGIQGAVKLQATLAKDGKVAELKVLSGHEMLVPAALEAVKQWEYQPTLVDGKPVEVITDINVNFTLSK